MKRKYEQPEVEIIEIESADIITASGDCPVEMEPV